jgi:NAD(P)-dependent dehydrogenase (short-subunit alcohol dehydrogenase family)
MESQKPVGRRCRFVPTILISGANRGIGLELARQFGRAGWTVHGTARDPSRAIALAATGATLHPLEATDAASIRTLAERLDGEPIDVLIANAGVGHHLEARPAEVTRADFLDHLRTNSFAPLALACALRANLLASERKVATAMSSLMSSIGANDWGTQYAYRASKTALNVLWTTLAREWRDDGITCTLLRPGMVATDMTNFRGLPVEESVAGLLRVVEGLTLADAGRNIGYDGRDVPW